MCSLGTRKYGVVSVPAVRQQLTNPLCHNLDSPSIAFYTQVLGAKPQDEWKGMRLEQDGIQNLAKLV